MKKYLEIYNKIKNDIIDGAYKYKDKLPSKRVTAENFKASIITVEHAYELLNSEGYIESEERKGFFVSYQSENFFIDGKKSENQKINNQYNISEENISFSLLGKTIRTVLNEYGELILQKSPNGGIYELRNSIKNYLERNKDIKVDAERIIIGSGAEYLYGLIIELFGKNKIYGIENPSYKQIENVYKVKKVKTEKLDLTSDGIDSKALLNTKADILHITPYRSFPTGITASASKKRQYINWVNEKNRYIIEDDYESEFSLNGKITESIFKTDQNDRIIYINTFTKTICKSMRVGYMILPDSLLKIYKEKLSFYSCPVPTLEQYVILTLLENGSFERHINRIRRKRRKEGKF